MKNLKLFNFHSNYIKQMSVINNNIIYPIASTCKDDNDLHIDNMFELVEYVENDDNGWINTDILYNTGLHSYEIKFQFIGDDYLERGMEVVIGHGKWTNDYCNSLFKFSYNYSTSSVRNKVYQFSSFGNVDDYSHRYSTSLDSVDLNSHVYKYVISDDGIITWYYDNVIKKGPLNTATATPQTDYQSCLSRNVYLFAQNSVGESNFQGRIYYLKIWDSSDRLLHYLLPIRINNSNVTNNVGFVDTCTGKTYFSSGNTPLSVPSF